MILAANFFKDNLFYATWVSSTVSTITLALLIYFNISAAIRQRRLKERVQASKISIWTLEGEIYFQNDSGSPIHDVTPYGCQFAEDSKKITEIVTFIPSVVNKESGPSGKKIHLVMKQGSSSGTNKSVSEIVAGSSLSALAIVATLNYTNADNVASFQVIPPGKYKSPGYAVKDKEINAANSMLGLGIIFTDAKGQTWKKTSTGKLQKHKNISDWSKTYVDHLLKYSV